MLSQANYWTRLPPGVDEAVAISKVVQLARSPDYKGFSRVIFDTAPTGHTPSDCLRCLSSWMLR